MRPKLTRPSLCLGILVLLAACETAAPPHSATIRFADVTRQAGMEHKSPAFDSSIGDIDGDGRLDIYLANHGSPAALLGNAPDGRFIDRIRETPIDPEGDQHGTGLVDFDNDGDLDLYVSLGANRGKGTKANRLYRNDGDGAFEDVAIQLGVDDPRGRARSVLWFDHDGDGWLDLFLGNYASPARLLRNQQGVSFEDVSGIVPIEEAPQGIWTDVDGDLSPDLVLQTPDGLRLLRNQDGRFVDQTAASGLAGARDRVGAIAAADVNRDGVIDLYLGYGTQYVESVVARDDEIRFAFFAGTEEKGLDFESTGARSPGLSLFRNGPRVSASDIQCGLVGRAEGDPATCAIDSTAATTPPGTGWVLFRDAEPTDGGQQRWHLRWRGAGDHHLVGRIHGISSAAPVGLNDWRPSGGMLWLGRGDGTFVAEPDSGIEHAALTQDVAWADFDNDGWLDLYVVDGGVEGENGRNLLFQNLGNGAFARVSADTRAAPAADGRGSAGQVFDYDRDGRLDLLLLNGVGVPPFDTGPYFLLRNETAAGHWIEIELSGKRSNARGLGAWLQVEACGETRWAYHDGGHGTLSQSAGNVHMGLGTCPQADRVMIRWPSGAVQTRENLEAGRRHSIEEPS